MSCDVGKATEGLKNELWRRWSDGKVEEWAELIVIVKAEPILQPFRHFTFVTTHSPTFPSLYLRHSSFSNLSVTSPTSQLILQPFRRFTNVTAHSRTLPLIHLRHSSFSNPSFASPTSQALHLIHLASRQWRVWFSAGSRILMFILRLGVLSFCSVLCCLWRRPWHSADQGFRVARRYALCGRKTCGLTELFTPLATLTFLYSRKRPQSPFFRVGVIVLLPL